MKYNQTQSEQSAHDPHSIPFEDHVGRQGAIADAIDTVKDLVSEALALFAAEKSYLTQRLVFTRGQIIKMLVYAVAAAFLAFGLLVAVVVGALLILTALIGAVFATIIVVGALVIIIGLLGLLCRRAMRNLRLKR